MNVTYFPLTMSIMVFISQSLYGCKYSHPYGQSTLGDLEKQLSL